MEEETWRYLVTVRLMDDEIILGEFEFPFEAFKLAEEIERVIRLYGRPRSSVEFRVLMFPKGEESE